MTAQIYYKIQNTYEHNINLSVTHAWRKSNFKSVFRINCTKMLINFIILFYQILCISITKQETQSEMGCGREKPRPKG